MKEGVSEQCYVPGLFPPALLGGLPSPCPPWRRLCRARGSSLGPGVAIWELVGGREVGYQKPGLERAGAAGPGSLLASEALSGEEMTFPSLREDTEQRARISPFCCRKRGAM